MCLRGHQSSTNCPLPSNDDLTYALILVALSDAGISSCPAMQYWDGGKGSPYSLVKF